MFLRIFVRLAAHFLIVYVLILGNESKVRVLLNTSDLVNQQQLMRFNFEIGFMFGQVCSYLLLIIVIVF